MTERPAYFMTGRARHVPHVLNAYGKDTIARAAVETLVEDAKGDHVVGAFYNWTPDPYLKNSEALSVVVWFEKS